MRSGPGSAMGGSGRTVEWRRQPVSLREHPVFNIIYIMRMAGMFAGVALGLSFLGNNGW